MPIPRNQASAAIEVDRLIGRFEADSEVITGIEDPRSREVFIRQILDSKAREGYIATLLERPLDPLSTDPRHNAFHPLKAAVLHKKAGDFDEAVWLVYIYVHFGMHPLTGWWYASRMYGGCDSGPDAWWTWSRTAEDPIGFRYWLDDHIEDFHATERPHGFGNHRKYLSLNAWSEQGTGAAIASYVEWVLAAGGDHAERFASLAKNSPGETFDSIYRSVDQVRQFGRTAKFDYITMLSRLGLVDALASHAYLGGATGPLKGSKLFFFGDRVAQIPRREVEARLNAFVHSTGVAPDILEDALCNWQKDPLNYVRFSA